MGKSWNAKLYSSLTPSANDFLMEQTGGGVEWDSKGICVRKAIGFLFKVKQGARRDQ